MSRLTNSRLRRRMTGHTVDTAAPAPRAPRPRITRDLEVSADDYARTRREILRAGGHIVSSSPVFAGYGAGYGYVIRAAFPAGKLAAFDALMMGAA